MADANDEAQTATLTKAELVDLLFDQLGLNKRQSRALVDAFFELALDRIGQGDAFKMPGFGQFRARRQAARVGRNLQSGQAVVIGPRYAVVFEPETTFKEQLQATNCGD